MTIDLFELKGSKNLFSEIQLAIVEYHKQPTSRLFLFLIFSLNHLREWISETSWEKLKGKISSGDVLAPGEEFFCKLWSIQEFRIINDLCNQSKHYFIDEEISTSITKGMTANSPVSDSLGQIYYRINGIDSREIFARIIREYFNWFATHDDES